MFRLLQTHSLQKRQFVSKKYWFKSAVLGNQRISGVILEIENQRIKTVSQSEVAPLGIEIHELTAIAGFVDIHCHGGSGYFFSSDEPGGISAASQYHLQHGSTSLIASLITETHSDLLEQIKHLAAFSNFNNLIGIHLEGPYLSSVFCGAHDPSKLRDMTLEEITELIEAGQGAIKMITIAPEVKGADEAMAYLKKEGVVIAIGHSDADAVIASRAFDQGAQVVTHFYSSMRPISHRVSSLALEALYDDRAFLEVILDGAHVIPNAVQLLLDIAPTRLIAVSDAISAAGQPDGEYKLGSMSVSVSGGVARIANSEFLAGSTLNMESAFRFLTKNFSVSIELASQIFSANPAALLGLHDVGSLKVGKLANILLLDDDHKIQDIFFQGEQIKLN